MEEVNWMAGGPQGSGVDSAANIFGRACGYGGLYVFGRREYHSNIKGLHSYFHLRISQQNVLANVNDVDLLAAFDAETLVRHINELVPGAGIIVDQDAVGKKILEIPTLPPEFKEEFQKYMHEKDIGETVKDLIDYAQKMQMHVFIVPYMHLLANVGKKVGADQVSKIVRMINVLTIGISFALLNYDRALVEKAVRAIFAERPKVAEQNIVALSEAYDYAKQTFKDDFRHKLEKTDINEPRIFISGNQAVAIGKIMGGCRVQTYYPITPAADESEYLEAHEIIKTPHGDEAITVLQTEDEIAAINSASGATMAGARAATSTSGPGFSLMVEGLSWAGHSEVPVVITYYQRGAPATGLPTRHGQSDLRFAMHAGHGEFARIILASGDIRECFYDAALAFNYAERYQVPVIHLLDKAMANCSQTYPIFENGNFKIERGEIVGESKLGDKPYERYKITPTGVSPRAFLGTKNAVYWMTGDEHNVIGHISEEPMNRRLMVEKRMKKLELIDKEVPIEEKVNFYGDKNSPNIIFSWGSPKGAITEAIDLLKKEGFSLGFMQLRMLHPLPRDYVSGVLKQAQKIIAMEGNYQGQLASIVKEETGFMATHYVLKYTGRPVTTTEAYDALKNILQGREKSERQVLMYGS